MVIFHLKSLAADSEHFPPSEHWCSWPQGSPHSAYSPGPHFSHLRLSTPTLATCSRDDLKILTAVFCSATGPAQFSLLPIPIHSEVPCPLNFPALSWVYGTGLTLPKPLWSCLCSWSLAPRNHQLVLSWTTKFNKFPWKVFVKKLICIIYLLYFTIHTGYS